MRVLVVDDDADICEFVAEALCMDGRDVVRAANGLEALGCLDDQVPDLVLLDMRMPVMDGFTFARQCRQRFGDRLPIVAMSAHISELHRDALPVAAFLTKPFDLDVLTALVRRFDA
jgi:CheY-like chemotaxis protein